MSSSSSSTRRVVFLMTRPDQGLSLPRAYTNGIAWIDGMGSEEFSSVRFDSLHFTDTPFSDDDDDNNKDDDNDDA